MSRYTFGVNESRVETLAARIQDVAVRAPQLIAMSREERAEARALCAEASLLRKKAGAVHRHQPNERAQRAA